MLVMTNSVATPIIEGNAKKAADLARTVVLEKADSFTSLEIDPDTATETGVSEIHKADNGSGYVVTSTTMTGYSGALSVLIGIDSDMKIAKIQVLPNEETAGIGKQVEEEAFTSQFSGSGSDSVESSVTMISGATISSKAVLATVQQAFDEISKLEGGQ